MRTGDDRWVGKSRRAFWRGEQVLKRNSNLNKTVWLGTPQVD